MKKIVVLLIMSMLLIGCGADEAIPTPIPYLTQIPYPTQLPYPTPQACEKVEVKRCNMYSAAGGVIYATKTDHVPSRYKILVESNNVETYYYIGVPAVKAGHNVLLDCYEAAEGKIPFCSVLAMSSDRHEFPGCEQCRDRPNIEAPWNTGYSYSGRGTVANISSDGSYITLSNNKDYYLLEGEARKADVWATVILVCLKSLVAEPTGEEYEGCYFTEIMYQSWIYRDKE